MKAGLSANTNIASSRASVEITLTLRRLSMAMKSSSHDRVADVVGENVDALVHDHLGILIFEDMGHGDLAVLARLVEHGGAELPA